MTGGEVCLITVNYRSTADIQRLLDSLGTLEDRDRLRVVIVNNGATGESRAALEPIVAAYPGRARVIYSPENLWYWRAAALALRGELERPEGRADWFIVCNDDIIFSEPGFLRTLLALEPASHAVIAPGITSALTGEPQNPLQRREMDRLEFAKWRLYFSHYQVARAMMFANDVVQTVRRAFGWRGKRAAAAGQRDEEIIYAPHGACMIFAREFFERGGTMDTGFTAYGEETSVGAIAKQLRLPVVFVPLLQVIHREHSTVGGGLSRKIYALQRESFEHCVATYGRLLLTESSAR